MCYHYADAGHAHSFNYILISSNDYSLKLTPLSYMHDDYVSIDYAFQMSWKHNEPVGVAIAVFNYKNQCEKGQQLIILVCK